VTGSCRSPDPQNRPSVFASPEDRLDRVLDRVDEPGRARRLVIEPAVEPGGAVERRPLVQHRVRRLDAERRGVLLAPAVAALAGQPAMVSARRATSCRRCSIAPQSRGPAEILASDDVVACLRPRFRELDIALLEQRLAARAAGPRGSLSHSIWSTGSRPASVFAGGTSVPGPCRWLVSSCFSVSGLPAFSSRHSSCRPSARRPARSCSAICPRSSCSRVRSVSTTHSVRAARRRCRRARAARHPSPARTRPLAAALVAVAQPRRAAPGSSKAPRRLGALALARALRLGRLAIGAASSASRVPATLPRPGSATARPYLPATSSVSTSAAYTPDPFAMWPGCPTADYYGPPPHPTSIDRRRVFPSVIFGRRGGTNAMVPGSLANPFDRVGAQLCPCSIATATRRRPSPWPPGRRYQPARESPTDAVRGGRCSAATIHQVQATGSLEGRSDAGSSTYAFPSRWPDPGHLAVLCCPPSPPSRGSGCPPCRHARCDGHAVTARLVSAS